MLSLAALECDAIHKALEVDVHDVAVLSSTLAGQLTGVALLHTLQLGLDSLVRNSMDSLLNGQTIVCADATSGLTATLTVRVAPSASLAESTLTSGRPTGSMPAALTASS